MIALNVNGLSLTEKLMTQFEPISLSEMGGVSLQDRVDTKYVITLSELYEILPQVIGQYRVLSVNNTRLNHYQTLYFDTPDFALFRQHHNGWGSRYKVRARKYVGSNLSFFEIKHKTNQGRTVKSRVQIPEVTNHLNGQINEFVAGYTPFVADDLEPKLWNEYLRITLVSKTQSERLTLDLNLEFGWGDAYNALPGLVIAEVKQAKRSQYSDFTRHMRQHNFRPMSMSKYCIGVCLLYDGLKTNNFKAALHHLDQLRQKERANVVLH